MSILTSYVQLTVMCVLYHNLSCFSTAVVLFAADSDELIFLLFDGLSKTASISSVFNSTLTPPTPKDSASLLYGWKQSSSKCLLYKLEWFVASHLSNVGFTWSAHFFLSSGSLEKPYRCSPCQQVELQPIELSYHLDNSKTTHSSITLHMLYYTNALSTQVAVPLCMSLVKPRPRRKHFKICFLNSSYLLEKRFWNVNF